MEKYYDLIVSLIKNHRKYNEQYESILDDIVKDVYNHSETLLSSVDDNEVIKSYLNKIVSVSIISVPRNLGITIKRNTTPAIEYKLEKAEEIQVEPVQKVQVDNNKADELTTVKPAGELFVEKYTEEPKLDKTEEPQTEELVLSFNEPLTEDNNSNDEIKVDVSLVDKMINGVPEIETATDEIHEEISETNTDYNEPETVDDNIVFDNDSEANPIDALYTGEALPFEELSIEEDLAENKLSNDNEPECTEVPMKTKAALEEYEPDVNSETEFEESELNIDSDTATEEYQLNADSDTDSSQDLTEKITEEEVPSNDTASYNLLEATDNTEPFDLTEYPQTELHELTLTDNSETLELDAFDINQDTAVDYEDNIKPDITIDNKQVKNGIDYGCFEFEPEPRDVDCSEIETELRTINDKNPEKRILEICKLKYTDKLSVKDIADTLEMSEESVLDSLYEIIDVVKDSYV